MRESSYISLAEAAVKSGYSAEYLRQLCVSGKLQGKKLGKIWVTTEADINRLVGRTAGHAFTPSLKFVLAGLAVILSFFVGQNYRILASQVPAAVKILDVSDQAQSQIDLAKDIGAAFGETAYIFDLSDQMADIMHIGKRLASSIEEPQTIVDQPYTPSSAETINAFSDLESIVANFFKRSPLTYIPKSETQVPEGQPEPPAADEGESFFAEATAGQVAGENIEQPSSLASGGRTTPTQDDTRRADDQRITQPPQVVTNIIKASLTEQELTDLITQNSNLKSLLKGEKGDKGDKGEKGDTGTSGVPYSYTAPTAPNGSSGILSGITYFGSDNLTAKILTVTQSFSQSSGTASFGVFTASGNVTLGDASSDTITFTGRVASHIVPTTDITYDLGSASNRFRSLYIGPSTLTLTCSASECSTAKTYNLGIITASGNNQGNFTVDDGTTSFLTINPAPTQAHVFTTWPAGTSNVSNSALYTNVSSAVADSNLIGAAVAGTVKFLVDAEGDVYANNLILSGSTSTGATTIAGNLTVQDNTTLGDAVSDTITFTGTILGASPLVFEGATANDFETTLAITDPTADRIITVPNSTGTLTLTTDNLSVFAATTSAQLAGVISDETGSGTLVFATSPTLVTPVLGVATATSINKVALTAPATSATLTIADGKTLTVSNTLTFTGTDASSVAFGGGGTATYTANNLSVFAATTSAQLLGVISDETGSGLAVFATSPTLTTPVLGVATGTSLATSAQNIFTATGGTAPLVLRSATATDDDLRLLPFTTGAGRFAGIITTADLTADRTYTFPDVTGNVALDTAGATTGNVLLETEIDASSELLALMDDETGTGLLVFATSPTLTTPTLGVATATTVNKVTITAPATAATLTIAEGKTLTASNTLIFTGTDSSSVAFGGGGTATYTANNLSVFAATTSAQLLGVLSDETGSGLAVFATSPTLTTPVLGVASGTSLATSAQNIFTATGGTAPLVLRSATATDDDINILPFTGGAGRFAGIITTADITTANKTYTFPDVTGNVALDTGGATTGNVLLETEIDASSELLALMDDETGSGLLVFATSPTLVTPVLGVASGTSLTTSGQGALQIGPYGAAAGNTSEARFLELAANGTNYTGFKAADSLAGNVIWTLPNADATVSGQALTSNASGVLSWTSISSALSGISAATGDATIANGANNIIWNWALTAAESAFSFGETTAASGGGASDQHILKVGTLATSTAIPLFINNIGAGVSFRVDDASGDTTPFTIGAAGDVSVGGSLTVSGAGPHAIGGATDGDVQLRILGTLSGVSGQTRGLELANTLNAVAGQGAALFQTRYATIAEAGSGTHDLLAAASFYPPTITGAAAAVTNTATVYINAAPTATVTGSNYSLWIDAGDARFDGNILPGVSPTAGASSQTITTVSTADPTEMNFRLGLAMGADGLPIIAMQPSGSTVTVIKCGNAACSSGNTTTTSVVTGATDPDIAIGTDGLPIIAFFGGSQDLKIVKCGNSACSSGNTEVTVDSTGDVGRHPSITIGTDGFPIISYRAHDPEADLKVAKCGDASCSAGNTITTVDTDDGRESDIIIGSDGLPFIAYYTLTGTNNLKTIHCGNITCSSGNTTTSQDTTGDVGRYPSLTNLPNGRVLGMYYDVTNGDLKTMACNTYVCGSDTNGVVATNDIGLYPAIAIGPNSTAVVSYYDNTNGDLVLIVCKNLYSTDSRCDTSQKATVLDSTGNVGQKGNIIIGTDGLPFIVYVDVTNTDVKTIKCALPDCSQTSGGSFTAGSNLGGISQFFNNVYANSYWGKKFQIANFDLAEEYEAIDPSIEAGDVVCLGTFVIASEAKQSQDEIATAAVQPRDDGGGSRSGLIKCSTNGKQPLGVISTSPAITLGDWPDVRPENVRPVALKGRVPVKVTDENGPIQAGDYLSISTTTKGYAQKMSVSGNTIGIALESFGQGKGHTGAKGSIEVFIDLSYRMIEISCGQSFNGSDTRIGERLTVDGRTTPPNDDTRNADDQRSTCDRIVFDKDIDMGGFGFANVKAIASMSGKWSISEDGILVAEKVQTKELCVGSVCVTESDFMKVFGLGSGSGGSASSAEGSVAGESTPSSTIPEESNQQEIGDLTEGSAEIPAPEPPAADEGGSFSDEASAGEQQEESLSGDGQESASETVEPEPQVEPASEGQAEPSQ